MKLYELPKPITENMQSGGRLLRKILKAAFACAIRLPLMLPLLSMMKMKWVFLAISMHGISGSSSSSTSSSSCGAGGSKVGTREANTATWSSFGCSAYSSCGLSISWLRQNSFTCELRLSHSTTTFLRSSDFSVTLAFSGTMTLLNLEALSITTRYLKVYGNASAGT